MRNGTDHLTSYVRLRICEGISHPSGSICYGTLIFFCGLVHSIRGHKVMKTMALTSCMELDDNGEHFLPSICCPCTEAYGRFHSAEICEMKYVKQLSIICYRCVQKIPRMQIIKLHITTTNRIFKSNNLPNMSTQIKLPEVIIFF